MNNNQRKIVRGWQESLEKIKSEIEDMQNKEQEKYENMPDGLQESEKGEALEEAAENLGEAASNIEDAIDNLSNIA